VGPFGVDLFGFSFGMMEWGSEEGHGGEWVSVLGGYHKYLWASLGYHHE
jgi:hypothetical protein